MGILSQSRLEVGEAGRRMVEVGDGLDQTTAGEVRDEGLEGSKGLGRLVSLIGVTDDIVAGRAFDEDVAAPAIAGRVSVPATPGLCRDQRQGSPRGIGRPRSLQLRLGVAADTFDILHQPIGILEDVVVDALQHVAQAATALAHLERKGVIDMPTAVGLR